MTAQKMMIAVRPCANAIATAPIAYPSSPSVNARLRPIRSATLLPIRMNAADTNASSAIAPWTLETVVPRSSTTLEIDTFISDVSTTRTNIAMASNRARRRLPASGVASGMTGHPPAGHQLPQLGGDDDRQARADADQPLVAGEIDGVQHPVEEAELGGEDDRGR